MNVFKMIDFIGSKNPNYTYDKVEDKLPSKPVKGKGYYDDNGKQGEWVIKNKRYWTLDSMGSYINGVKEGIWEYYWEEGPLRSKGLYINGEKEGIWETYFGKGDLSSKGGYKNDKKEGYWEYYWDNGGLYKQGTYKDGKKDGIWEEYFKDGEFWYEGEWNNGKYIRDIKI
jgi:antitoxin component YwqK of YwqJK toxin-antitoxin module